MALVMLLIKYWFIIYIIKFFINDINTSIVILIYIIGKEAILFNAVTSKILYYDRNTPVNIVYDTVLYDSHGAYSSQSGVFTAPYKGLYIFTWSTLVAAGKILDSELIVNGTRKGLGNCNNEGNPGFENCANTVPVMLEAGDTVNIRSVTGNYVYGDAWSSFKGWRN